MIYHEDLQTANLIKNHHLAKSIQDAGWSQFLGIFTYKAACAGRRVIVSKGLSVRWHACPECGTSLH
jgi:putative transposase